MDLDDVTYLAQELIDRHRLSSEDEQKLKSLNVKLEKEPLPQHEIETRAGTRTPSHEEIEKFEQIEKLIKGPYLQLEDDRIVRNWQTFCKMHNWNQRNVTPFLHFREGKTSYIRSKRERRKFVQFLADGLPNRTLYSIYHRFRNLYENHLQRRYAPNEDSIIIDHIENNRNLDDKRKYADLAKVLNRTRGSVWRRYRILQKKRNKEST